MVDNKTLEKIQKLLAYAASTTSADAAAFLEKAQAIMAENNISIADIQASGIGHVNVKSQASVSKMKPHELALANLIGRAFGAKVLWGKRRSGLKDNWARWSFIAEKSQLPVIEYMATVLLRKLTNARVDFVSTLPADLDRSEKTMEADGFCLGWVRAVAKNVHAFAGSQQMTTALEAYIKKEFGLDENTKATQAQKRKLGAEGYEAGEAAGAKEQFHRPMNNEMADKLKIGQTLAIGHGG